jgi:two-component system cell cycle sensor histidine kinase/response regulator CckA
MEAIGRLTGGVAHDFNNAMTVVIGFSDVLTMKLGKEHAAAAHLAEIRKAGNHAATLTRQLLAFSRKQVLHPQVLELNDIIGGTEKMIGRLLPEDIELKTVPGADLGRVKADPGQVEQVLMNLVINARDAMPLGGRITIDTRNVTLDEAYAARHVDVRQGPYVQMAVSDTGTGMDEATRNRIFEPFFTNKETGKGTGLGLATVYGIIMQSGGHIWVDSEPGHGTTFKIYLPIVDEAPARPEPELSTAEAPDGSETVLLAEDEDGIRELIVNLLREKGYTVLASADPAEARRIGENHAGPIHLMLTDVVMPGMSGRDLARSLAGVRPDMEVLYMSGYTNDAIFHHGVLDEGIHFLEKPFTPLSLLQKVRQVLDGHQPEAEGAPGPVFPGAAAGVYGGQNQSG